MIFSMIMAMMMVLVLMLLTVMSKETIELLVKLMDADGPC